MQIEDNNRQYSQALMDFGKRNLIDNGDDNNYGFIPTPVSLIGSLNDIFKEGMTLIDLGCGPGNVLTYAKNIGYDVLGVDWNRELLKELERTHSFIHRDIRELDKSFWNSKDVVYIYVPVKKNFKSLLYRIARSMKSGAYLVTPEWEQDRKGFTRIDKFTIRKD